VAPLLEAERWKDAGSHREGWLRASAVMTILPIGSACSCLSDHRAAAPLAPPAGRGAAAPPRRGKQPLQGHACLLGGVVLAAPGGVPPAALGHLGRAEEVFELAAHFPRPVGAGPGRSRPRPGGVKRRPLSGWSRKTGTMSCGMPGRQRLEGGADAAVVNQRRGRAATGGCAGQRGSGESLPATAAGPARGGASAARRGGPGTGATAMESAKEAVGVEHRRAVAEDQRRPSAGEEVIEGLSVR